MNKPVTANRYYVQDEWGEILVETGNQDSALRIKAHAEVVEGRRVRFVDRLHEEENWKP